MKNKVILAVISICLAGIVSMLGIFYAFAADVSEATYRGNITITNNSTAATGVSTVLALSSADMISQGYIAANWSNVAVLNATGADVAFGPSINASFPWSLWVPSIGASSVLNYNLYTGGPDMGVTPAWFPGTGGGNVTDSASLKHGDNFSDTFSGYLQESGDIINKPDAYNVRYDLETESIIASIFSYTEVDTADHLTVTPYLVTSANATSQTDAYVYNDKGAGYFGGINATAEIFSVGDAVNPNGVGGIAFTNTISDISGLAATDFWLRSQITGAGTINMVLGRGDSVTSNSTALSANIPYYVNLLRESGSDNVTAKIYTDDSFQTSAANMTISGVGTGTFRYAYSFINLNSGVANRYWSGYIKDFSDGTLTVTATGISVGEYDLEIRDSPNGFSLYVDSLLSDNTSQTTVPDNSNDYQIGSSATPYIYNVSMSVNGTAAGEWEWEYTSGNFMDLSGNGNGLQPTFRTTSSDADVSAALTSFAPITQAIAPPYSVNNPPTFITGNITVEGAFNSGNVTGSNFPGVTVIDSVAGSSGTPNIWIWGILAGFTIALGGMFITYMVREHGSGQGEMILRMVWVLIVIGLLVAFGIFDWWMVILYILIALGPMIASRHNEIGASVGELNLIGFLSMAWVGLTTVNRIIGGQLITSAETAHLNNYMFTQEFTLLSVFKMPIINFQFFTKGIPSLLKWDYSFFGGNAQIIQYFLYSLTAVMAFIVLGFLAGLLTSYFSRIRA